jgi:predicted RNA methylase
MTEVQKLWDLIHANYSHLAHCQHQVELSADLAGRRKESKLHFIRDHIAKLINGYTDTVYASVDFGLLELNWNRGWNTLAEKFYETYYGTFEDAPHKRELTTIEGESQTGLLGGNTLSHDVLTTLKDCEITEHMVKLPPRQLDPKLYGAVKTIVMKAGGNWSTKEQGFVFKLHNTDELKASLGTGKVANIQQKTQAFYTPDTLADEVVMASEVKGYSVLEPSAGSGALVRACLKYGAREVHAVESDLTVARKFKEEFLPTGKVTCWIGDFLKLPTNVKYARIVMNPPFTKNQDCAHVEHAMKLLSPRGKLVAIMSGNQERKPFRALVKKYAATVKEIDAGAFAESGTNIKTVMVTINNKQ